MTTQNNTLEQQNELAVFDKLDLEKHGVVMASAGTGKTYTVQNLILRLLMQKKDDLPRYQLSEILIVTYTEKATGELKDRIRAHLNDNLALLRGTATTEGQYPQNSQGVSYQKVEPNLLSLSELEAHLEKQILNFDQARIFTIHGFCQRVLKENALNTALPMKLELTDGKDIASRIVRDWWNKRFPNLGELEQDAILSGRSIEDLFESLEKVLLELDSGERLFPKIKSEDLEAKLKKVEESLKIFPTFSAEVEAYLMERKNFTKPKKAKGAPGVGKKKTVENTKDLDRAGRVSFLRKMSSLRIEELFKAPDALGKGLYSEPEFLPAKTFENVKDYEEFEEHSLVEFVNTYQAFQTLANQLDDYVRAQKFSALSKVILEVVDQFQTQLRQKGLLTFNAMISNTAQALQDPETKDDLIKSLQETYKYAIIDEFQDTTNEQWQVFKSLFLDRNDPHRNILVVGDPKQSIYSFQGAELETCQKAVTEIEKMNLKISKNLPLNISIAEIDKLYADVQPEESEGILGRYELNKNYRSSPKLIKAYDELFKHESWFGASKKVSGLDDKYLGVGAGKSEEFEGTALSVLDLSEYKDSNGKAFSGEHKLRKITDWALERIIALLEQGVSPSEIAVLGQKRKDYAGIVSGLKRAKIPVSLNKSMGLFRGAMALEFLVCLEGILGNQQAQKNKALLTQFFGLHAKDILGTKGLDGELEYGEKYNLSLDRIEELKTLVRFAKWGSFFKELWKMYNPKAKDYKLDRSAFRQISSYFLRSILEKGESFEVVLRKLRSLYLGEISESDEENAFFRETSSAAVQVMTLHSSKGLEFPYVIIPSGMGSLSNKRKSSLVTMISDGNGQQFHLDNKIVEVKDGLDQQEWMRLFYVGYTRAEKWMGIPLFKGSKGNSPFNNFIDQSVESGDECLFEKVDCEQVQGLEADYVYEPKLKGENESESLEANRLSKESFDSASPLPQNRSSFQSSFTGLSRLNAVEYDSRNKEHDEGKEVYSAEVIAQNQNPLWKKLPKGASTGNLIHEILENTDFRVFHSSKTQVSSGGIPKSELIEEWKENVLLSQLKRHQIGSFKEEHQEAQKQLILDLTLIVSQILNTPMKLVNTEKTILLTQLAPQQTEVRVIQEDLDFEVGSYQAEPEFWFPFGADGRASWEQEAKSPNRGWMQGFIDLLFEVDNKYYVLDWKTNTLPSYDLNTITDSMEDHKYNWQASLYGKAVQQWLSGFGTDKQVGGAVYFYVRGASEINNSRPALWQKGSSDLKATYLNSVEPTVKELVQQKFPNLDQGES